MEGEVFLQWRGKELSLLLIIAVLMLLCPIASPLNDQGALLLFLSHFPIVFEDVNIKLSEAPIT